MTMEKRRGLARRAGVWLASLVALLLVAYLVLIVTVRGLVDPVTLADRAEPYISAALNRQVTVSAADLSIFPRPEVRLLRIRVENLPDFEGLPLATVDELRLRPRILPLLRRRVEIHRVEVVGPRVLLRVAEDGRSNFGDFVPASRESRSDEASTLSFEVHGIDVSDGRVGYRDAVSGRMVQVDDLRASGSVGRSPDGLLTIDIEGGSDNLRFALPPAWERGLSGLRVAGAIRARLGPMGEWIEIESGTVSANRLALEVSGRVDSLRAERRSVDLHLVGEDVDLSELVSVLPDSVRERMPVQTWGTLHADLSLRGIAGGNQAPQVDGLVLIRDAGARRGDAPALVDQASMDVRLARGVATASELRAVVPGGGLSASGTVALDSTLSYRWEIDAEASAQALVETLGLARDGAVVPRQGSLHLEAVVQGKASESTVPNLTGALMIRGLELTGGRLATPLEVRDARIRLQGDAARWSGVSIQVGEDEIRTDGSVSDFLEGSPTVEATARARRLDIDALIGPGDLEIGYGRIAWARVGDRSVRGRSPEEWATERGLSRPGSLPVSGVISFEADSLIRLPYRLSDVRGRVLLEPGGLEIADTRFGAYGGTGTVKGTLALGEGSSEPFRLAVDLRNARAEEYLGQNTPLGGLITGTLSMDLSLEGSLDRLFLPLAEVLQGSGQFEIRDGGIAANPLTSAVFSYFGSPAGTSLRFSRWASPVLVRDGLLVLEGGSLTGTPLDADLVGALGFGGSVDLGALVRPDSALAAAASAGSVLRRYLQAGGLLELALRVTGQASSPRVELDPQAMEESGRSVLRGAAEDALQSGQTNLRERGRSLLRNLTGQDRDTAAAADTADSSGGG